MFNILIKNRPFGSLLRNVSNNQLSISSRSCSSEPEPPRTERTINSVQLLGRVGVDPQKRGSDEHPVVTFSLATSSNYKFPSGEWAQKTEWHKIVVFKPNLRDAVMNYLTKGQRAIVNGKISYSELTDQDGKARLVTSIIADDVIFLQSNKGT